MDEGLLTVRAVARDWLRKSERGVWKDIACGRFGPDILRLGRCVRIRANELREWIEAGCPPREKWVEIRKAATPS